MQFIYIGCTICLEFSGAETVWKPLREKRKFIQEVLNGKSGKRIFSKLVKRLKDADTTLQLADIQMLYYGQIYMDNYTPGGQFPEFDEINTILSQKKVYSLSEAKKIVSLSNQVIDRCPCEPMGYYYKYLGQDILCQHYGGDTNLRNKTQLQYQMLFYAILSSGNGMYPRTAVHVVSLAHENILLNTYDLKRQSNSFRIIDGHNYDIVALDRNKFRVNSMFFNIDPILAWDKMVKNNAPQSNKDIKKVTSAEIDLGTRFVLELVKTKKSQSTFKLLSCEKIQDTLTLQGNMLYNEPVPYGRIVGYFCKTRPTPGSNEVHTSLILNANYTEEELFFDSEIHIWGIPGYHATPNNGLSNNWQSLEWNDEIATIRISNIRTQK